MLIVIISAGVTAFQSRAAFTEKLKPTGSARFDKISVFATLLFQFSLMIAGGDMLLIFGTGMIYGFYLGPFDIFLGDTYIGLLSGLAIGLSFGLLSGLYNGFVDSCFVARRNILIYRPYKRFFSSILSDYLKLSAHLTALFLILLLIALLKNGSLFTFSTTIFLTIMASIQSAAFFIAIYNSSLVKHLAIRWILFIQGKAPLRYSRFLKKVAGTGIMEQDGGEWRFRHQLIQDLFAEL